MSRIYEAVKKAELDRSATLGGPRPAQTTAAPEEKLAALIDAPAAEDSSPAGLPVYGTEDHFRLDDLRSRRAHALWHVDPSADAFAKPAANTYCAEQFRKLRSRLGELRNHQPLRTLVITSPSSGEGKTFTVINIAQALIQKSGLSVLVIDADLRRPRAHALLGATASPGLVEYLRGEVDATDIIQFGRIGQIDSLCFIGSGAKVENPSELLSNGRFETLLRRLMPAFDWILIDSPPCLPVADASILADLSDGVLLVAKAGSTPSTLLRKAQQQLQKKNVVGMVLNAAQEKFGAYRTYY